MSATKKRKLVYVMECGCELSKGQLKKNTHGGCMCPEHGMGMAYIRGWCACGAEFRAKTSKRRMCDACQQAAGRHYASRYARKHTVRHKKAAYGFDAQSAPGATLQTVADLFGITRERARQIELMAMRKFKKRFYKYYPDTADLIFKEGVGIK